MAPTHEESGIEPRGAVGVRHGVAAFALGVAMLGLWGAQPSGRDAAAIAAASEPAPPPQPEPIEVAVATAATAQPAVPPRGADAELLAAGQRALADEGSLPALVMDYGPVGFARYVDLLRELGATAVVISGGADVVGEIDLTSGEITDFTASRAYSPRARDYSDEPTVARTIDRARRDLDDDSVTVLVAVPAGVDELLFGALVERLDTLGLDAGGFKEFSGRYEPAAGEGLIAHIEHGTTHAGARHALDVRVDIGSLAGYARPARDA